MIDSARPRNDGWRRFALILVACALFLRLALPAGWMPETSATGVTLRWCSEGSRTAGAEAQAMLADAMGTHEQDKHGKQAPSADQPCAFAAAASAVTTAEPPAQEVPVGAQAAPAPARPTLLPGRGLAAPPPFATGPPAFA